MKPNVQYARTSDGISIAHWSHGEGDPLVEMPPTPFSHAAREWDFPEIRDWYTELAARWRLIRYDNRGTGLSQRQPLDFSLEASARDLDAVLQHLDLQQAALFAPVNAGPVAITYAVKHPKRVSRLVLWCTYARGTDFFDLPETQVIRFMVGRDWRLLTETAAHERMGWREGEAARRFAELIREAVTPEAQALLMDTRRAVDVSALLPEIRAPTLVLHRETVWTRLNAAQELASGIPAANLVVLEGASLAPYLGNTEEVLAAMAEFLGGKPPVPAGPGRRAFPATQTDTAVILFADIADSTALTEQFGDAAFRERARELDGALRAIIRDNGGTPVEGKLLGDGVLAVFASARRAIEAAQGCGRAAEGKGLLLHLGIHAGDVIREEGNVYGGAVNIAARVASASAPGEILVSDIVRGLARTSAGVAFEDRGQRKLKGIEGRQRLFAVRGQADS